MNKIEIFNFNGQPVREIEIGGNPWWVLKDVCNILDIRQVSDVVSRLEKDEVGKTVILDARGANQQMYVVNEYGLYNVLLRSSKPIAKDFKRWITHEIMPSVIKHGAYMTRDTLESALLNPDNLIKLATQLKQEQDRNSILEATVTDHETKILVLAPKADYYDALVDANLLTSFREFAKETKIPEQRLINGLITLGYLYRDRRGKVLPYSPKCDEWFRVKECGKRKNGFTIQTLITPKGREKFLKLFQQNNS